MELAPQKPKPVILAARKDVKSSTTVELDIEAGTMKFTVLISYFAWGLCMLPASSLFAAAPKSMSRPSIRPCMPEELRSNWSTSSLNFPAIAKYQLSLPVPIIFARQFEKSDNRSLTSLIGSYAQGNVPRLEFEQDRYRDLFGFLPIEAGSLGSELYRRWHYDSAVDKLWLSPPGKVVEGSVEETSTLLGRSKTVSSILKVKLLGCADIPLKGNLLSAKVFRVVMDSRALDTHTQPPSENIIKRDITYFVSLKYGIVLRDEQGSVSRQILSLEPKD